MSNQETIDKYYKYLNNYQLADLFLSLRENKNMNAHFLLLEKEFISGKSKYDVYFIDTLKSTLNDLELLFYTSDKIDLPEKRVNKLSLNYLLRFDNYEKFFNKLSSLYDVSKDSIYHLLVKEFKTNVYKADANFKDRVKMMMNKYIQ